MHNSLRIRLTIIFIGLAIGPLLVVGFILAQRSFTVEREQALELQQQVAQRVAAEIDSFLGELANDANRIVGDLRNLGQPDRAQQISLLLGAFGSGQYRDVYEEFALLDAQGQEQLRLSRDEIISADELRDLSGAAEFEQPRTTGNIYFSSVWFDDRGKAFVTIAVPFSEPRSVELKGVLIAHIRFKKVSELISGLQVDQAQTIYVVDSAGQVVAHRNSEATLALQELHFEVPQSDSNQTGLDGSDVVLGTDEIMLGEQELIVVAERLESEALRPATDAAYTLAGILIGALIIAAGIGFLVVRQIVQPIEAMSTTAQAISDGDLSQQVEIASRDEIGTLANAFNSMTAQLRQSIDTLEQQVAARTRRLEVVATLSEQLTAILDFDELLAELVEQVKETFGYYHAHVYILDEANQSLVMTSGAGEAGVEMKARGHQIALNAPTSLVAQAARTAKIVWVDNVRETEAWLPNPLLPDTYSEMAVPIIVDNQVVGVLDVQENKLAGFDEGDANLLRSLANQVANAIRNARLFAQVEKALTEARAAQERFLNQAWQDLNPRRQAECFYNRPGTEQLSTAVITHLEQKAITQQGPAIVPINNHESELTVGDTNNLLQQDSQKALVSPIRLQNQTIGAIQLFDTTHQKEWDEEELALVEAVADQVAQVAENLRLFDETRERAGREQTIREITDKLRAAPSLERLVDIATEELSQHLAATHAKLELGIEEALPPSGNGDGTKAG